MLTSLSMCCVFWVSCDDPYVIPFPTFYRKKKKKNPLAPKKPQIPFAMVSQYHLNALGSTMVVFLGDNNSLSWIWKGFLSTWFGFAQKGKMVIT